MEYPEEFLPEEEDVITDVIVDEEEFYDLSIFVKEFRWKRDAPRADYHEPSLPQMRALGSIINARAKIWNDVRPDKKKPPLVSHVRKLLLSALCGKVINSQKEMDAGEHSILIDMFEKENQFVRYFAIYFESQSDKEAKDLFPDLDVTTNVLHMQDAVHDNEVESGHARSPVDKGTRAKPREIYYPKNQHPF